MAWVKAAVTFVASIWSTIKAVAAVAYVIYLWKQYKKANQSPTYGFDIQTQSSNELPIPIVYGKVKAAGNIVWQRMSDDKSTIYAFVAFSEGPIEGFEDVRANDIPISELPGCSYTAYLGTPDQVIDERCPGGDGFFEHITNADRAKIVGGLRHVAYIAFTIKASDKISGGMPNFTAIVKGRKVRVWENESWITKWTENPVWHLLDLLTHTRYGGGYTDSQINIEGFKTAAAFCDEILSDGQPRFTEGIIIDWVDSLPDIVDQIRFTCRGYVVSYNGKLTFKIEQPEEPCQHFSMENIVEDSLEIYVPGKDEEWQKVTVTYCEPNQNWAKLPAQSVDESNPLHPVQKDFTIVGVNRFSQASRLAYFYRVYSKYCRFSGKFKTTIRALNRIPGDVITISDDIMGWVEKPVRILEIRHAGDYGHEIYFREYNETIYNDALGSAEPTWNYSTLPNAFAVPPDPTNLEVNESTFVLKSGEVVPEIEVLFTPAQCFNYGYSLVQLSSNGGINWSDVGPAVYGKLLIHGIRIGQTYLVKVKTVSIQGIMSAGITAAITVAGKDRPPSDVPKLSLIQMGENIKAVIVEPDDPDINCYELRMGSSWDNSIRIKYFTGDNTVFEAPMNGSLVFWVKAIDNSRNLSANATKCAINVVGLKPKNIIFERVEDTSTWQATAGMYRDYWGYWRMRSIELVDDYQTFDEVLAVYPLHVTTNASEIILPEIDLGPNVIEPDCYYIDFWGEIHLKSIEKVDDYQTFDEVLALQTLHLVEPKAAMQTLLGIDLDWNSNHAVQLDIEYRVRVDGDGWSVWTVYSERQFFGRRLQIRLLPRSLDGVTSVVIRGGTIKIDVPDVEDIIENVPIEAVKTKIKYHRKFYTVPKSIEAYTRDLTGKLTANRIDPTTITNADCDLEILDDNDNVIAGKLELMRIRGY